MSLSQALFLIAVRDARQGHGTPFADVAVCIVGGLLFPAMYGCIALLRSIWPGVRPDAVRRRVYRPTASRMLRRHGLRPHRSSRRTSARNKTVGGLHRGPGRQRASAWCCWGLSAKLVWQHGAAAVLPALSSASSAQSLRPAGRSVRRASSSVRRGSRTTATFCLTHGGVLDRFDSMLFIAPVGATRWLLLVLEEML